jgi:hypothetical protein
VEFIEFPKMARLTRECIITEKIDGTNAQIAIGPLSGNPDFDRRAVAFRDGLGMFAGKRGSWCTPEKDNFGFAAWVKAHADELWALGEGRHYGEWWGSGIQRGYGLVNGEKRFSLFNVSRWVDPKFWSGPIGDKQEFAPICCHVVPLLERGLFTPKSDERCLELLRHHGSYAAPGFMKPEGIVVFHVAAGVGFKKTLEKDDVPKSQVAVPA